MKDAFSFSLLGGKTCCCKEKQRTVLLGGVGDIPRAKEQLTAVALQFPQITEVDIQINGTPIDEYFSSQ